MAMATRVAGVHLLFCDLVGSTELLSRIGDEENDEVRRDLFEALRQPLGPFGGLEVKSQGDGLMVAFSGRVSDAIGCAIAMHRAVTTLGDAECFPALSIRVGVSSGEVTSEEDDWFGRPVVEAARLCGAAAPGQILVPDHVIVEIAHELELVSVGGVMMKGFADPVPCSAVAWDRPLPARGSLALPIGLDLDGQPAAVGLHTPMAAAAECWDAARNGSRPAMIVRGEPRTGRTRFVSELARVAFDDGAAVLFGRTGRLHQPFEPIAEAFRPVVLWGNETTASACAALPSMSALVPAAVLRGAPPAPDDVAVVDITRAIERVLHVLAETTPVLFLIDDADLVDDATADVLIGVLCSLSMRRVMIVLTARIDEDEDGAETPFIRLLREAATSISRELELTRLREPEVAALLGEIAPAHATGELIAAASSIVGTAAGDIVDCGRMLRRRHDGERTDTKAVLSWCIPYKGLVPLGRDDAGLYFGRAPLIEATIAHIHRHRFVAVVGPSGSGKSSALRAGVVPEVSDEPGRIIIVTPPELAAVLHGLDDDAPAVVVDQFEELFTLWTDAQRRTLIDEVLTAFDRQRIRWLAIAVRADHFAHCADHETLAHLVADSTVLVGAVSERDLRDMIVGPANAAGLQIEPGFADVVTRDLADEPVPLPLLSHALMETWRRRRFARLSIDDYRRVGGIRKGIARTAERAYSMQLDGEQQTLARALLLRLVEPGEHQIETRRPLPLDEVRATFGPEIDPVLGTLADARLLVVDDRTVALAHEALINEWPRLAGWIRDDRDALDALAGLRRAAHEWAQGERQPTDLYRGDRLDTAIALSATRALAPIEREFVAAGNELRLEERLRDRRTTRRLRRQLVAALGALAIAITATGVAVVQQRAAARERNTAQQQREDAQLALLAGEARDAAASDISLASLLAVEADRLRPGGDSTSALEAALSSQQAVRRTIPLNLGDAPLQLLAVNADATSIVVEVDTTAVELAVPDFTITRRFEPTGVVAAAYSPDGANLALLTVNDLGIVPARATALSARLELQPELTTLQSGSVVWVDPATVAIADDHGHGVILGFDGESRVAVDLGFDAPSIVVLTSTNRLAFVQAATYIDGTIDEGTSVMVLREVDPSSGRISHSMEITDPGAFDAAPLANGRVVVGTSKSGARVVDIAGGTAFELPAQQLSGVRVAASPNGQRILTIDLAGRADYYSSQTWSAAPAQPRRVIGDVGQTGRFFVGPDRDTAELIQADRVSEISLDGSGPIVSKAFIRPFVTPYNISDAGDRLWVVDNRSGGLQLMDLDSGTATPTGSDLVVRAPADRSWRVVARSSEPFFYSPAALLQTVDSDGEVIATSLAKNVGYLSFAWSRYSEYMVSSNGDGSDFLLEHLPDFDLVPTPITSASLRDGGLALSDDGSLAARSGYAPDGLLHIEVREVATGNEVVPTIVLPSSRSPIWTLAFSPDARRLAFGDADGEIDEIDLRTGDLSRKAYVGLTGKVHYLGYSSDNARILAFSSIGGEFWWWDTATHRTIGDRIAGGKVLFGADNGWGVAVSSNGSYVAMPTEEGLRVWNRDPAKWPPLACARAGRNLTQDEWRRYLPTGMPYHVTCEQYPAGT